MGVISLELNELNFRYVQHFVAKGKLPTFARLLRDKQLVLTDAGEAYPQLEPWIQWPTVYTGKSYTEHGLFRLGDISVSNETQIWDYLEARGKTVGAVSPINASNRCANPAFFLPDPWTDTKLSADPGVARAFELICKIVNSNASSDVSLASVGLQLLPRMLPLLRAGSVGEYLRIVSHAVRLKWAKAAGLDRLLADLFISLCQRDHPDYASLFLNAGAHIQHHHMFESSAYGGDRMNPAWYSRSAERGVDPLLFIYSIYDSIIADVLTIKGAHVFITTAISQIPNSKAHYQYRIVDFVGFMAKIGLEHTDVQPRMSRDFLLAFHASAEADAAVRLLDRVRVGDKPLFVVDQRSDTLFCQVGYFGAPEGLKDIRIAGSGEDLSDCFVLVSIENGIHTAEGYHLDTRVPNSGRDQTIPLTDVFDRLCSAVLADSSAIKQVA